MTAAVAQKLTLKAQVEAVLADGGRVLHGYKRGIFLLEDKHGQRVPANSQAVKAAFWPAVKDARTKAEQRLEAALQKHPETLGSQAEWLRDDMHFWMGECDSAAFDEVAYMARMVATSINERLPYTADCYGGPPIRARAAAHIAARLPHLDYAEFALRRRFDRPLPVTIDRNHPAVQP